MFCFALHPMLTQVLVGLLKQTKLWMIGCTMGNRQFDTTHNVLLENCGFRHPYGYSLNYITYLSSDAGHILAIIKIEFTDFFFFLVTNLYHQIVKL